MLHILNLNKHSLRNVRDCRAALTSGDEVVILDSAEIGCNQHVIDTIAKVEGNNVYWLKSDGEHNHVDTLGCGVTAIDMRAFVKLTESHKKSVSWF
ncbi:DsrH/TusB family sulfur metabolism protein [Aurantivibrio plasticivorans]